VTELEERLRASLGTKVIMRHGKKGGTLTIHYYSDEELDTLLNRLL
jgi:ParB family chromosome partitioning protein